MKLAAVAVVALVFASGGAAHTGRATGARLESWADARHGWRAAYTVILATENGGASWHPVLSNRGMVLRLSRTSATAGVALLGTDPPRVTWARATRDGGRHWFQVADEVGEAQGRGSLLFFTRARLLLRVRPWPPKGSLFRSPLLHFSVAARLRDPAFEFAPGGSWLALANVPGGVAALTTSRDDRPGVLVHRNGRTIHHVLPTVADRCASRYLTAHWPRIDVHTVCEPIGADVAWRSNDGGRSWTVVLSP